MIARTWHGVTPLAKSEEYLRLMQTVAIPDYRATPGNLGAYVLHRVDGDEAHFTTLSLWESTAAIEAFAGEDINRARYYDFDDDFLLEKEPTVTHYDAYGNAIGKPS